MTPFAAYTAADVVILYFAAVYAVMTYPYAFEWAEQPQNCPFPGGS